MSFAIHGIGASKGVAIGKVHLVERGVAEVPEYKIAREEVEREVARFHRAVEAARGQLESVKERIPSTVALDIVAFIDTHLLMLEDSALTTAPVKLIREKRRNAEWALKTQRDSLVGVFEQMDDPYLRTRKDDVDHVVNRVQRVLLDVEHAGPVADFSYRGRVVCADDLTPADTVLMQDQGVAAFITERGGPNSHTAILARSLRIPAVVGMHRIRSYLHEDEEVVVDGRQGVVLGDPDEAMVRHYRRLQKEIQRIRGIRRRLRKAPAITLDGEGVNLQANVELPSDVESAREVGAKGVGLYRTEYLFMNRKEPPDEEEQYAAYARILKAGKGAPVTIRTLDLGADKQLGEGWSMGAASGANPAMGLRAVRLCLKQQGLFRVQLRAVLRASALSQVRLMVPMLSTMHELAQVRELIRECHRELDARGRRFDPEMPIGAMIEVPAAAICADLIARQVDFLSIGTNDLIQYTMAIDRDNDEVNYLYDPIHPAVLRLIRGTIQAGKKAKIPVAMCGEMAGDAKYTRLLLGMGLREFSVHPNALLEVKQAINESHLSQSKKFTQRLMRSAKASTRHALLEELNDGEY